MPTIGYDMQELTFKNVKLRVYDLSGQENLRNTWKYYYESINGLIFVIDSTCLQKDTGINVQDIKETIHQVLTETQDSGFPVLFLANKQDLPQATSAEHLWQEMQLDKLSMKRAIKIMPTSGTTGQGLDDAFSWIVDTISAQ